MKIGYDPKKVINYFNRDHIRQWTDNEWISVTTRDRLLKAMKPEYKHTNLFIGIGLFLLTVVIINASIGLFTLFIIDVFNDFTDWIFTLLLGTILFISLQQVIIKRNSYFRSGVDNATLYAGAISFFLTFIFIFEPSIFDYPEYISLFLFTLSLSFVLLYRDRFLVIVALGALYAVVFFQLYAIELSLLIPFALMLLSGLLYWFSKRRLKRVEREMDEQCWDLVKWWSTALFYLSGNIYVVTELSEELGLADAFPEPVRWFFYLSTVIIPFIYIINALKYKQLALLNIGLGAIALSIFALQYYHPLFDLEYLMLILGVVLLLVAWLALKYTNQLSFNVTSDKNDLQKDGTQIEALIIMEAFGKSTDQQENFDGKGGKFSGGGASGDF